MINWTKTELGPMAPTKFHEGKKSGFFGGNFGKILT